MDQNNEFNILQLLSSGNTNTSKQIRSFPICSIQYAQVKQQRAGQVEKQLMEKRTEMAILASKLLP